MERYVIRGGREGYERLLVLARAMWPHTSGLLEEVGVEPGMRCLDLGCGGGAVTLELARMVSPGGEVVGIDMDEVKLDLARTEALERDLENVEFRNEDVVDWRDPGAYDFVYCRFLLEHLREPLDVLRRMWEGVRPGGVVAVEDADFDGLFCDPPNDGHAFWIRTYTAVLARNGGDPQIGRKLHRMFLDAGTPPPRLRMAQEVNTQGETKTLPLLTVEATAAAIREAGLASERELSDALESLARFTEDPSTLVGGPRIFGVWARRS